MELTEDLYETCILVYRYLVSVMDYLGFKYAGPGLVSNDLIGKDLLAALKAFLENRSDKMKTEKYKSEANKEREEYGDFIY